MRFRTNLKIAKESLKMAITAAVKYGICEYENGKLIRKAHHKKLISYLALVRPVLGFVPMLLRTIRVYGV